MKCNEYTRRTVFEVHADLEASWAQLRWWLERQYLEDAKESIAFIDQRIRILMNEPVRESDKELKR